MSSNLAVEAQHWAALNRVEEVRCWLPDFEQVCAGVHTITAVGHDGMAVNIIVDNEAVRAIGAEQRDTAELVQLAYLGRMLRAFRRQEMATGGRI